MIKGNFLPVGHTHEDIDALFGIFSKHLRLQDVYTFDGLCDSFEQCTDKPHPESHKPQTMYDVKEWLSPHSNDMHHHVQPHCFKFVRNENGKAVMFYRKWSGEKWMGPIRLLKSVPESMPSLLQTDFAKADLPKLRSDILKWHAVMSTTTKNWWDVFLDGIDKELLGQPADTDCPMFILKNECQRPITTGENVEDNPNINMHFREKEVAPLEEIYTGAYQPPAARGVCQDDNFLEALVPGVFVAVHINNYKKVPVIGKAVELYDDEFKINYWQGSYCKPWKQHVVKRGRESMPWTDMLPKQSIILCGFELDDNSMLAESSRKYLKRWYRNEREKSK